MRTRRTPIALVMAAALVVAACGGDDDAAEPPAATQTPADDAAADPPADDPEPPAVTEPPADDDADPPAVTEPPAETAPPADEPEPSADSFDGMTFPTCAELDGAVIGYSQPIPDPNFALIDRIIETKLAEVGAEYIGVNAQFDPGKQVADLQILEQQGIDVLVINPLDPTVVDGLIQGFIDSGVPVVVQETSNDDGRFFTQVTVDVQSAASRGVAIMAELVGDGSVGGIIGPPIATVLVRQAESFAAASEEHGLNVIDTQITSNPGDPGAARSIAEAWKQQHPDLAGIWTFNDTSAVGVAAMFDAGFSPVLVSINGQPEAIPLVEAGRIAATFDLQHHLIARALTFAAAAAVCGEDVPQDIWIETLLIDADNVGDWVPPVDRDVTVDVVLETRDDGRTFIVES